MLTVPGAAPSAPPPPPGLLIGAGPGPIGTRRREVEQAIEQFSMWKAFARAFVYPLTGSGWLMLIIASINPVVVVTSIVRVAGEYALVWVFCAAMYFLSDFALVPLASVSVVAANIVRLFFQMYVVCVIVSRLGFMSYRNRYKLGWG